MNRKGRRVVKTAAAKSDRAKPPARRWRRSAIVAVLFSSFAIGLEHLYARRLRRGIAFASAFYGIIFLSALHFGNETPISFRFINDIRRRRRVPELIRQICYPCLYRVHRRWTMRTIAWK